MLKKNLNEPVDCTPSTNCRLMLAPGVSGEPRFITPVVMLLLFPPPRGWAGGVSSVVPFTTTLQGDDGKPDAVHVAGSLTLTVIGPEVNALRSATPPDTGVVLISTIRKRN
jgi:hypothetical protein